MAIAQRIRFSYDQSGNMVKRGKVVSSAPYAFTSKSIPVSSGNMVSSVLGGYVVRVGPNPTLGLLCVNVDGWTKEDVAQIQVYSVQGVLLHEDRAFHAESIVDLSKESPGIYFLRITISKDSETWKIIKL